MKAAVLLLCLLAAGCSTSKGGSKPTTGVSAWLAQERINAIRDMAPKIGIPVDQALKGRASFKACDATGKNGDGPYICGDQAPCAEIKSCVHAWCIPDAGGYTRYMFASIPDAKPPAMGIVIWTVRHEVMHELLDFYQLTGHPLKCTVKRLDNGQSQTFKPGQIIGGRWPSMVNVFLPESSELSTDWGDEIQCGTGEVFHDGGGI